MGTEDQTMSPGSLVSGVARTSGATMTEVAAAAGVSQTTVSLVLNDALGARLSAKTRQRVLEAAKSLNYRLVKRGATRPSSPVPA